VKKKSRDTTNAGGLVQGKGELLIAVPGGTLSDATEGGESLVLLNLDTKETGTGSAPRSTKRRSVGGGI